MDEERTVAKPKAGVPGYGDLNAVSNDLKRDGAIFGYQTSRPEKGADIGVEAMIAAGAVQTEIVRFVREVLPPAFTMPRRQE